MSAESLLCRLAAVIDAHRWSELPSLLHPDFRCHLVHTGETFDRDGWVRLNAEYPGFQHFVLQDWVATDTRAAGRAHVTGMSGDQVQHFAVATFLTARADLVVELTEVWTDIDQAAPPGTRPT